MTGGLLKGLGAVINRLFPERQFYHRSHGEVHFVALSGRTQFAYVALTLAFLTWVGYASVNVVFKEQIISEKEQNFIVMQRQYEQRLADLEGAYDEINSVLITAEERFQKSTQDLVKRHEQLKSLVDREQALNEQLDAHKKTYLAMRPPERAPSPGNNSVLMRVTELEPSARRSRRVDTPVKSSLHSVTLALGQLIKKSVTHEGPSRGSLASQVAGLESKIEALRNRQRDLVFDMEEESLSRIAQAEAIIDKTGLAVPKIESKFEDATTAVGGPFIALRSSGDITDTQTMDDPAFQRQSYRLATQLDRLSALETALVSIPLAIPLNKKYRFTSKFGARYDPFSRRRAFHSGMDMASKRGIPVFSTAAGVVTHAGPKGPYGNMVEINHGHGFKTRYGHLRKIFVKKGQKVDFYKKIGEVGSTGRSTGPHLHYEVWFNNKVRDPSKFFEAGNYVFKE